MIRNQSEVSVNGVVTLSLVILNAIILRNGMITGAKWYWALPVTLALLIYSITEYRKGRK
ncbi:MAG TPA: hypothetical protein VFQ73_11255 [Flavisolibacter sp.]|nr:hypothetical protein [Flavisolibacter sp.]